MHTYVIHNPPFLLIPQQRHAILSLIPLIIPKIHLTQELAAEEMIHRRTRILIICFWEPPSLIAFRVRFHNREGDDIGQVLNVPDQIGAVRKWAEEALEVVC